MASAEFPSLDIALALDLKSYLYQGKLAPLITSLHLDCDA